MKLFFFILILFSCVSRGISQDYYPIRSDSLSAYPPKVIIKFSYLSLFDFKQSIQFAVEYKIKSRINFQNELGYINTLINNLYSYENFRDLKGLRTRFEVRFYQKNRYKEVKGFYLAPEIFYIYSQYKRRREVGRGCVDGGCDYFELKDYIVYKNIFGQHFKIGYQTEISGNFLIDFYGGVGIRHVFIHAPEVETADRRRDFMAGNHDNGTFLRPSMSLGFKVGYLVR